MYANVLISSSYSKNKEQFWTKSDNSICELPLISDQILRDVGELRFLWMSENFGTLVRLIRFEWMGSIIVYRAWSWLHELDRTRENGPQKFGTRDKEKHLEAWSQINFDLLADIVLRLEKVPDSGEPTHRGSMTRPRKGLYTRSPTFGILRLKLSLKGFKRSAQKPAGQYTIQSASCLSHWRKLHSPYCPSSIAHRERWI